MRELEKRQRIRRQMYSLPMLCLVAFLSIFLTKGAYNLYIKERETIREREALLAKVADLVKREEELKSEMGKLGTLVGLEEEIKSKFNVARAGERVAIIIEPKSNESTTTQEFRPWYRRIWDAILGK